MSPLNVNDVTDMQGQPLYASDGVKIGEIADIYVDSDTREPEWALVHTGLFGARESFVPLAEATRSGDGIRVPYTKDEVRDAPTAEPDGELSPDEEARLYAHYGLSYSEAASSSGLPAAPGPSAPLAAAPGADEDSATMVRSEERLHVRVQRRPSEIVRLRKVVVTENVTRTVPVRHEELVIEREPITDGQVVADDSLVEEDHEIILHAERAVLAKETVPVERVRVGKAQVVEDVEVTDQLRKEHIEVTDPAQVDPRTP